MSELSVYNPTQATTAWQMLYEREVKPLLMAGHRGVLSFKRQTRSHEQNALLHAILTEIAATREWAGQKRDAEVWKRLLTAAWLRARGEGVEVLPALDGYGVDIVFRRTSKLTTAECTELIEFIEAWRASA